MSAPNSRIALLDPAAMSAEQRAVAEEIASGPRGQVRGPALLWLHSPELARRLQRLGEFLRWQTAFEGRLSELAILITARHFRSDFIWFNHVPIALEQGLSQGVIDSIESGQVPQFVREDEAAVHAFTTEILTTHAVRDATLGRIKDRFGERGAIELVALVGHYHLGAITLATARLGHPSGRRLAD